MLLQLRNQKAQQGSWSLSLGATHKWLHAQESSTICNAAWLSGVAGGVFRFQTSQSFSLG